MWRKLCSFIARLFRRQPRPSSPPPTQHGRDAERLQQQVERKLEEIEDRLELIRTKSDTLTRRYPKEQRHRD